VNLYPPVHEIRRLLLTAVLFAGPYADPTPSRGENPAPPPAATNLWFPVGETIRYDIYWGIIHVGESLVTTGWVPHDDGRTMLRIRFDTHSNKVLSKLYPVSDVQESLIDPATFLPVYFRKDSRQGRHVYNELTRFDHAAGKAYWESYTKGKQKVVDIQPDTRDLITMMYYIRSMNYALGTQLVTQVFTDEKIYDLFITIPRKDIVELPKYGRVASLMFEPEAAFEGLFVRKGKMYMWVSDDARRICTKIEATVPVASVRIQIAEVTGPGEDFWVGKAKEGSPETTVLRRHKHK